MSVQYDADMASVNARLDALEKGNPPAGKVTVDIASYESLDGSMKFDNTAEVQSFQDTTAEYYVWSATKPHLFDPFLNVPKLERITYHIGSGPKITKVFDQTARIELD